MTLKISKNMTGALGPFSGGIVPDNSNTNTTIQILINEINLKESVIPSGTSGQYIRGDKTLGVLSKTLVGLSEVDNTSDINKPISTLTQTALNAKEPSLPGGGTNAHYLRGDKTWVTMGKVAVGLSNVDNTSDANKPISTAQQAALDGKASTALVTTTTAGLMLSADKIKLNGINTGATANSTDTQLRDRSTHTGTQSVDTLVESTTIKLYTVAEQTKLSGIAAGATANSTDALLRDRSTHTGSQAISSVSGLQTLLDSKESTTSKGVANGYAPLGADGKIPSINLPENGSYKGNWDASTNTPTIVAGAGTNGDTYTISVAGTQSVTGTSTAFTVGDQLRYTTNGNKWERIPNTQTVSSVAGLIGTIAPAELKTALILAKADVGLGNVDNTSDVNKPISLAMQTALNTKAGTAVATTSVSGLMSTTDKTKIDSIATGATANSTDAALRDRATHSGVQAINTITNLQSTLDAKEPSVATGTTAQYYRGDKSWQSLNKTAIGLANVDNTSDANKPVSTATSTALNAKQNTLISGTSIKTIAGLSVLGSGDLGVIPLAYGGTGGTTASTARSALGLGTVATANIGSSGSVVPLLNNSNTTWSGNKILSAIGMGATTRAMIVDVDPGATGAYYLKTSGLDRWRINKSNNSESGSNYGSDFSIVRCGDDGVSLGAAITILRSSGETIVGGVLSATTLTAYAASASVGGTIILAKPTIGGLSGNVVIDTALDSVRFFENGGSSRGFYLHLPSGLSSAGANIMDRTYHIGEQPVSSVTGLQPALTALTDKINASQNNLLNNGGLEDGFNRGVASTGGLILQPNSEWGPYAYSVTDGQHVFEFAPIVNIQVGSRYWVHIDPIAIGASSIYCDLLGLNDNNEILVDSNQSIQTGPINFSHNNVRRGMIAAYCDVPSGITKIIARVITNVVGGNITGFRRAKVETGPMWTPFSAEATIGSICSDLNTKVTAAYVKGLLGSDRASVLDITGFDPTGSNDMASGYQALINQAAVAGVPVEAPGCQILLGSTINLPQGHVFRGFSAGAGPNTNAKLCSTFILAHSGKGFIALGPNPGGEGAIHIFDQSTKRIQPAVVSGQAWAPSDHDYDYHFLDTSNLRMARILTQNATRGIYLNGGRNTIEDWSGQCYKKGLHTDFSYDTFILTRTHLWPFTSQAPEMREYTQNNLTAMQLNRVDNPFIDKFFSIWHQTGIRIGWYIGDGQHKPAGTVSKLKLISADIDIGDIAYHVIPEALGHTANFVAFTAQCKDIPTGQPLIFIEGSKCKISGDFGAGNVGGNIIRMAATSSESKIRLRVEADSYNKTNNGYPAFEVAAGGGQLDILPGSLIEGGNGAPISSGNVIIWQPPV